MRREKPSVMSVNADAWRSLSPEADYSLNDISVAVTSLPSAGVVLKADQVTPVAVGDRLTAVELAALSFAPAFSPSRVAQPWSGQVIYIPENCGRLPIPLFADLAVGPTADKAVVITEIPSNGSVFLADGMTAVVCCQEITAAQLCGLTFRPAANAVGQISLLRYRSADQEFLGEILLVVGPDVPSSSAKATNTASDNSSVAPLAAALLLQAGLSSLKSTAASAAIEPNDFLPADSVTPTNMAAGIVRLPSDQAPASNFDHVPDDIVVPASEMLQMAAAQTGITATPDTPPHHRIGSSSPPDVGSLKLTPSPSTGPFQIANNAVLEIKGPASGSFSGTTVTFDTGNW